MTRRRESLNCARCAAGLALGRAYRDSPFEAVTGVEDGEERLTEGVGVGRRVAGGERERGSVLGHIKYPGRLTNSQIDASHTVLDGKGENAEAFRTAVNQWLAPFRHFAKLSANVE